MDALIKALKQRGYEVEVTEPDLAFNASLPEYRSREKTRSRTVVQVGNALVQFALQEDLETVWPPGRPGRDADPETKWDWSLRHSSRECRRRATGRLRLRLCSFKYRYLPRKSWGEGKRRHLEAMLNEFIAGLIDAAERTRLWEEERERQRLAWAEAERRRQEEERRRELEQKRLADLEQRITDWAKARTVDDLVAAVARANAPDLPVEWLTWAREHAARLRAGALSRPEFMTVVTQAPETA
jgi:hypothetical protein